MRDERSLRRDVLREGPRLRLADGGDWTLPNPPTRDEWRPLLSGVPAGAPFGPDYVACLGAYRDAADEVERRQAELAAAICLLGRNYDLSPPEFRALLAPRPGETPVGLSRGLLDVIEAHVRSYREAIRDATGGGGAVEAPRSAHRFLPRIPFLGPWLIARLERSPES